MQVPAFVDALKTYTHTISAFPLREYFDGQPVPARQLLSQPSPIYPYANVIQRTLSDLLMFDRAYWLVIDRDFAGYPVSVEVMRVEDVIDTPAVFAGIEETQQPPADPFYYLSDGYRPGMSSSFTDPGKAVGSPTVPRRLRRRQHSRPRPSCIPKHRSQQSP